MIRFLQEHYSSPNFPNQVFFAGSRLVLSPMQWKLVAVDVSDSIWEAPARITNSPDGLCCQIFADGVALNPSQVLVVGLNPTRIRLQNQPQAVWSMPNFVA